MEFFVARNEMATEEIDEISSVAQALCGGDIHRMWGIPSF
jgi:hypothetical protein